MYTLRKWLDEATKTLIKSGIPSASLDAQILAEHVLHKNREHLLAHGELVLNNRQEATLNSLLAKRQVRVPIAYLTNQAYFYGQNYYVNSNVLIPRPESESFISLLLLKHNRINSLIDVGTGSGVLGISAKLLFPDISVTCSDISKDAISVAKKNARNHKVSIKFKKQYLLDNNNYNAIFANLPYVPSDFPLLDELSYEPAIALRAGNLGMQFYHELWDKVAELTTKPLYVFTESLLSQHPAMINLAQKYEYKLDSTEGLVQVFVKAVAGA